APVDSEPQQEKGEPEAPQATAVADVVDRDKLVSVWPAVVDQVRESGSGLLARILGTARPVALNVEEAILDVGFPASEAFNKRKAEAAEARDSLTEAVKSIVGERLRPVYILLEGD